MPTGTYPYYNTFLGGTCFDYKDQSSMYGVLFSDEHSMLSLQNHDLSGTGALANEYIFASGSATVNALSARSVWGQAYCVYNPSDANQDAKVFLHGRFIVGGGTVLLSLSTDSGVSFTNVSDGTWSGIGDAWVGAMWSPDTALIYVFLNGTGRGLWRTEDGGTTWTKLANMPFDVDWDNITLDGSGNWVICNREAASLQVAVCRPPYSVFEDLTENVPTATPKTSLVAIS